MKVGTEGVVFDIQRWSLHDGPGIRTNVFLKGCPLSCLWCSNPESQEFNRELAYFPDKCIRCGKCIESCPFHALEGGDRVRVNYAVCREKCYRKKETGGFLCAENCYAKALKIMGRKMSVSEVLEEVLHDYEIYRMSGGGLTVTGGEPFAQPEFLLELLREAKKEKLDTAVESSLYMRWEAIAPCLRYTDLLFMDFKISDRQKHKRYTGVDNGLILENMKKIHHYAQEHPLSVTVRTPVIPGVNDTVSEIGDICEWIRTNLPGITSYELLPYHRLGRGKYSDIGKEYRMEETEVPSDEKMRELKQKVNEYGLNIQYGRE